MNTQRQTKVPSLMRHALRGASVAVAAVVIGLGAAGAQSTPAKPALVVSPTAPAAAHMSRTASQYDVTFKRIDSDGNGSISKTELEKADSKLGQDFKKYDTDGDSKLSPAEFAAMMKAMRE